MHQELILTEYGKRIQKNPACLICAAGRSSRMGACKPLLPLGKETLLRQGILTMKTAGVSPVVVVVGRESEAVAASIYDLDVEIVINEAYASTQMFDSVKMGLRALKGRCGRVLFSPADVPLYSVETLRMLIESPDPISAPAFEKKTGHPVCFDAGLINGILAYEGPGGLSQALSSLGEKTLIECADEGILIEADTPDQYEKMKEFYARNLSGKTR